MVTAESMAIDKSLLVDLSMRCIENQAAREEVLDAILGRYHDRI